MTHKRLTFRSAAREKILRGAAQLADAVRVTLGPRSKSVLIEKKWGKPVVCDDGVTIAKEVELPDAEENLGCQMLREPAERTQSEVGDGTTTATLFAHAILQEGMRNVVAGSNAVEIKRGLERGFEVVKAELKRISKPVVGKRERAQVATLSAHGNPQVGELVANALEKVGPEGVVSVEEAKGTSTELEVVEGMQFDNGWLSPYFVTDPERMECVLVDALVLLYDKRVATMQGIVHLLEHAVKLQRPLLIIAEDVEGEALATLVVNKLRGARQAVAVKAPGFGDRRRAMLEDLGVLTGAQVLSEDLGIKLEKAGPDLLGRVKRVIVTKEKTTLVGGEGAKPKIAGRIEQLRRDLRETKSDYDREKLQERLAKLSGGVAIIRVGAASEAELKQRKDALDDAINATKAAVAEGIVPGAGLGFLRCIAAVEAEMARAEGDERIGLKVLAHALAVPARQIAENSGFDGGVVAERMKSGAGAMGFDASKGVYCDLLEAGIIDPTKVGRVALENAISAAGTLLLTEALLTELPAPAPAAKSGLEME
ncbi:MAG: chaperonin GroEL [Archangiaceae bacterium]|nr:chaperonin GroEL [Archangiaceae bacterium]